MSPKIKPHFIPSLDTYEDTYTIPTTGVSQTKSSGGSNPEQYALPAEAQEVQDLIEYREMNFAMGNIFKACYRHGKCNHSDEIRDLEKIIWFATRELERLNSRK